MPQKGDDNSRFSQDLELIEHVIHSPLDFNISEDSTSKITSEQLQQQVGHNQNYLIAI